ncbi:LysM peptidoglycan-binding domain-containing protein [Prevotella sp. HCN-7019]|uniref:LysM peptidoglycan-binding domain-containing protein n=1 Tax=Prevotella sp. HCN-7019 TaxID=3134668 RepID=UPI0030C3B8BF
MRRFFRYCLFSCFFLLPALSFGQTTKWQDIYKVKKKDTVYGIAKKYNITPEELMKANPAIPQADYKLKKGEELFIPYPVKTASATAASTAKDTKKVEAKKSSALRVGIMLPLHDEDGDGRRMVEYYRGFLMACDSLRAKGISTDVYAWNVTADADIRMTLLDDNAKKCDMIFGPLYTSQLKMLGDFCRANDIKLIVPFSISGNEVEANPHIYQVYQSAEVLNERAIKAFMERFPDCHPVFIDCNDTTSNKGSFTFGLRKQLEAKGIAYSITNLKSSEAYFAKAFSTSKRNVVILNTGRSPQLNVAFAKLDGLCATNPGIRVSMFGYTEWLMYTKVYLNYFYKYDTYIPTTFYYNALSEQTEAFESSYRKWFKSDMQTALPRFALTGYDHACFFIGGEHARGKSFRGTKGQSTYRPLQTPLKFEYASPNGGMRNNAFMLVHYMSSRRIESISY